ncbi:hypothetical protein BC939DRAFT_438599, partial [Gamsiella multidivaricata]|uniref:uncharacterized protein n=1 Tax=Gamsiella multidivaricata TaxID=101098 RepID=UPI00221F84F9
MMVCRAREPMPLGIHACICPDVRLFAVRSIIFPNMLMNYRTNCIWRRQCRL